MTEVHIVFRFWRPCSNIYTPAQILKDRERHKLNESREKKLTGFVKTAITMPSYTKVKIFTRVFLVLKVIIDSNKMMYTVLVFDIFCESNSSKSYSLDLNSNSVSSWSGCEIFSVHHRVHCRQWKSQQSGLQVLSSQFFKERKESSRHLFFQNNYK